MKIRGVVLGLMLGGAVWAQGQNYVSPCDVDWDGDRKQALYVTGTTGRCVLVFDSVTHKVVRKIEFPSDLTGTTVSHDGQTLYVTGGGHEGKVFVVDAQSGSIKKTIPAGHTPVAPVLSPDGKTLYVCERFDNAVAFLDLASGKETGRVAVLREPIAADITQDGRYLYVANHNPDGPADVDYVASKISVIDTQAQTAKHIKLVNGSEGVRGVKLSPDGKYMFATHFMARFLVPTTQLERGWVSTDALSVMRVSDHSLQYTVLLDDVDLGFANPWAIDFSDDAKTLVVSSAAGHELSLINLPELTHKIELESSNKSGSAHLDAHNNLSFLSGIRQRITLPGNGPRALAVKGNTAYVAHYYSDSVDVVEFENQNAVAIDSVELNPGAVISDERQGEIFFNDANLCFQKWLSCTTCHPDARTDALNWDLLNDGIGNPKNVKSMLLAHKTPRAMILGVRADAETGVRAGLKYIQFAVRPESDALKIDAYLKSLKPEPSPYLVNGQLSPAAQRGKKLFEEMSCASCHPAPLFTDLQMYEVGTPKGQDTGRPLDTPTLVECWRTAPYLHDGRAATMHDVLVTYDHAGILSETEKLTEAQLKELEEYILSL